MTIGKKIRRIRNFRGMTQRQLGLAVGFDENTAIKRIGQYETGVRSPKKGLIDKIAKTLHVDPLNFYTESLDCAEDIIRTFFWLEEDSPGSFCLFQLTRNPGKCNSSDDTAIRYNDTDDWPATPPVGMYFKYRLVDEYLREWLLRQQELKAGKITKDEYFEWKLNWPYTCDGQKITPQAYIPWRKEDIEGK